MPLRSVEAATRDDAIAAAREQFGPSARVVGVRRVRSGGVLGFFATERYVAEVAPDAGRPSVPVPAPSRSEDLRAALRDARIDESPADFSSPLSSAAPARARTAAPPRNGAAAWAAEAARSVETRGAPTPARAASSVPARSFADALAASYDDSYDDDSFGDDSFDDDDDPFVEDYPARPAAAPVHPAASAPRSTRSDAARVSEIAGLLAAQQAEAEGPAYTRNAFPRASFPRTGSADDAPPAPAGQRIIPGGSDAPSPFTAALARMVAGDRDVQQAVREALERPAGTPVAGGAETPPARTGRPATADSTGTSRPARQEEETVGEQVIAPSLSMREALEESEPVDMPTWAAEPEPAPASTSSREEAIAEVLRSALAQGHSDEALAGILRKVLAGVSPQTALTEPEAPAPAAPQVVLEDIVVKDVVAPPAAAPAAPPAAPVAEAAVTRVPLPEAAPPVTSYTPPAETFVPTVFEAAPRYAAPRIEPLPWMPPGQTMWGEPALPSLWDERTPVPVSSTGSAATAEVETDLEVTGTEVPATEDGAIEAPEAEIDAPIWAEVAAQEAAHAAVDEVALPAEDVAPVVEESVVPEAIDEVVAEEIAETVVVEETASEETAPEVVTEEATAPAPEETLLETVVAETEVQEIAVEEIAVEDAAEVVEEHADDAVEDTAEAAAEAAVEETVEDDVADLADEGVAEEQVQIAEAEAEVAQVAPLLARTASDPAPMMSLDATTVMPPLSLLPPLPSGRGRGRPPVPPAPSRSSSSRPMVPPAPKVEEPPAAEPPVESPEPEAYDAAEVAPDTAAPVVAPQATRLLATVTRLPVAPLMATPETPELSEDLFGTAEPTAPAVAETTVPERSEAPAAPVAPLSGNVAGRLEALGVPAGLLGAGFADDVTLHGTYAALTRALALRLPKAPQLPNGDGEVLFVVGPGVETLRAARSLAATLRLDPDRVQWATRGDLAALAPEGSRITTLDSAMQRRQAAASAGSVTIVAVDATLRTDTYWMAQMTAIWTPTAVWAVVDATRKPEDLGPWIGALPQVDALMVQDTEVSVDPAAVLRVVDVPVAMIDGARATPHRWASLLCERLESSTT